MAQTGADECLNYSTSNPVVGLYQFPIQYDEVIAQPGMLYAFGRNGIAILDASVPSEIAQIGMINTQGGTTHMRVVGDRAYLGETTSLYDQPVTIWDISNPARPERLGRIIHASSYPFEVIDNHLFSLQGNDGINVYDVTDPRNPQLVHSALLGGNATDMIVSGSYAFIRLGGREIRVVYLGVPESPAPRFRWVADFYINSMAAYGDYLFLGGSASGIQVFDTSSLPIIRHLGPKYEIYGNDLEVDDGHLLVYAKEGIHVFSLDHLPELEYIHLIPQSQGAYRGSAAGGLSYELTGHDLVRVIDYHVDASQPDPVWSTQQYDLPETMQFRESLLYSLDRGGLKIMDPSPDNGPIILSDYGNQVGRPIQFLLVGDKAVVLHYRQGVVVYDISDPYHVVELSRITMPNGSDTGLDIAEYRGVIFVSSHGGPYSDGMITTLSLSDPLNPQITNTLSMPRAPVKMEMIDDILVTLTADEGIQTYQVSAQGTHTSQEYEKSLKLEPLGFLELPPWWGFGDMITVRDDIYILHDGNLVRSIDCSDPANPLLRKALRLPTNYYSRELAYGSGVLYATNSKSGVAVINAESASDFNLFGYVNTHERTVAVAVGRDQLYVSVFPDEVRAYQLQCTDFIEAFEIDVAPHQDSNFINCRSREGLIAVAVLTTADHDALHIDHSTVRLGADEAEEFHHRGRVVRRHETDVDHDGDLDLLFHFRISDTGIQCGDTQVTLTGTTYDGDSIMGVDTIWTERARETSSDELPSLAIVPNPFNPQTVISFVSDHSQWTKVSVYDIRGRKIADLANRVFMAGENSVVWQGRDSAGRAVPSGQYFFRIETEGGVQIKKALLLK